MTLPLFQNVWGLLFHSLGIDSYGLRYFPRGIEDGHHQPPPNNNYHVSGDDLYYLFVQRFDSHLSADVTSPLQPLDSEEPVSTSSPPLGVHLLHRRRSDGLAIQTPPSRSLTPNVTLSFDPMHRLRLLIRGDGSSLTIYGWKRRWEWDVTCVGWSCCSEDGCGVVWEWVDRVRVEHCELYGE